jgi:hypothetical protein
MKRIFYFSFLCLILVSACKVDYFPESLFISRNKQLIVNGLLDPSKPIKVNFYTLDRNDSGYQHRPVKNAHVVLKEDGTVLFDGICPDTVLHLEQSPRIGAEYFIEAEYNDYPPIKASTRIPATITCKVCIEAGLVVNLSDFEFSSQTNSLWVTAYKKYIDGRYHQYSSYFTRNLLVDNVNRLEGSDMLNDAVGSGYHEGFMRVKAKSLSRIESIIFTPLNHRSVIDEDLAGFAVRTTAASREYDMYNKTFYEQLNVPGGDLGSVVYQPVHVYTNIENGLGIFAGLNQTEYFFEIMEDE